VRGPAVASDVGAGRASSSSPAGPPPRRTLPVLVGFAAAGGVADEAQPADGRFVQRAFALSQ
jgi:hypothetical protein